MLAKREYYHTAFNTYSNKLKTTWKSINEILSRNNKKRNLPLSLKKKWSSNCKRKGNRKFV